MTECEQRAAYFAARVDRDLWSWIGFREGRESAIADSSRAPSEEECRHAIQTSKWRHLAESCPADEPRDLLRAAVTIAAEARGIPHRRFWRGLLEADRDPQAEIPRFERRLLALYYATKATA
jgi:hypothetical protein